jgi:hypothetical protein
MATSTVTATTIKAAYASESAFHTIGVFVQDVGNVGVLDESNQVM